MDELENLLAHFGLGGKGGKAYDLFGHSWGGMLASRFAASGRPRTVNLRRLVIADSPSTIPKWEATSMKYLAASPAEVQAIVKKHEDAGTTAESTEYKMAVAPLHAKFTIRTNPMPEEVVKAFALLDEDPTVSRTMYVLKNNHFLPQYEQRDIGMARIYSR